MQANKLAYLSKNVQQNTDKKKNKGEKQQPKIVDQPISLAIARTSNAPIEAGADVELEISSNTDGYLYCYFQRGDAAVQIFPNRFSGNGYLSKNGEVLLPNSEAFSLVVDTVDEQLLCFLTPVKVDSLLPQSLRVGDFQPLSNYDFGFVSSAFDRASSGRYGYAFYQLGEIKNEN